MKNKLYHFALFALACQPVFGQNLNEFNTRMENHPSMYDAVGPETYKHIFDRASLDRVDSMQEASRKNTIRSYKNFLSSVERTAGKSAKDKQIDTLKAKVNLYRRQLFDVNKNLHLEKLKALKSTILQIEDSLKAVKERNALRKGLAEEESSNDRQMAILLTQEWIGMEVQKLAGWTTSMEETIFQLRSVLLLQKDTLPILEDSLLLEKEKSTEILKDSCSYAFARIATRERILSASTKTDKDTTFYSVVPQAVFTNAFIIPTATFIASSAHSKKDLGIYYDAKLFYGGQSNSDSLKLGEAYKLLIPEASKFGAKFQLNINASIGLFQKRGRDNKNLSVLLETNFLFKDLLNKDTTEGARKYVNSLFSHSKIGLEISLLQKYLSVYGKYNFLGAISGVSNFSNNFPELNKSSLWFFDTGILATYQLDGTSKNYLLLNLGLILQSTDVKTITQDSDDIGLPTIQLSYKRDL